MTRDAVPARWQAAVLVCAKCSKRVGGGFGPKGKTPLAKALRQRAGKARGRKAPFGVVETPCLKLCPRRAVVAIAAHRPGEWLLVEPGTPVDAIAARLGLPPAPDA